MLMVACCATASIFQTVGSGNDRKSPPKVNAKANAAVSMSKVTSEPVEVREFEIRVDNRPAGTHSLSIKSAGEMNQVSIQSDVKMDFIVYAYVFKFRATEIWRSGRVERADIRCEDGGKKRSFAMKTEGDVQQVSFNGKPTSESTTGVMTTAYWQLPPSELRTSPMTILDVDTGAIKVATLREIGPDNVTYGNKSIACRHFKIDGPSPAELWFDDQNRLVRQKSIEQGHATELRLKDIRMTQKED